jgi:hypothetical protein
VDKTKYHKDMKTYLCEILPSPYRLSYILVKSKEDKIKMIIDNGSEKGKITSSDDEQHQ